MARRRRDRYVHEEVGGRYKVLRRLADGGMARVYVARDEQTRDKVAIKILPPRGDGSDLVARMQREAAALERLDHPNIVTTLGSGALDDGGYYIAMEYIEGPSLTQYVREAEPEPEEAVKLLLQVCSALRHAHRKGVVHRDLKASNLLVATDERGRKRVKLIDFGIVKLSGEDTLSGSKQIVGSVHTIAPEQVRGEDDDHRVDIYAVGILMYRLISGRYPYHSRVAAETLTQHVHAEIPTLDDPTLPDGLADVVARCMAKQPDERFEDIQALMDELSRVLDVPTAAFTKPIKPRISSSWPPTPANSQDWSGGEGSRMAMAAGVVLLVAVALLWIFVN